MSRQQLVIGLATAELTADTVLPWWLIGSQGELVRRGEHSLAKLADALDDIRRTASLMLLVPGELVLLTSVSIPSRQLRQIKQALPYMVEELIADNIEEVHLALPDQKIVGDEPVPVAVIHHSLLIGWLDQLYSHGLEVSAIVPDALAAPWRAQTVRFLLAGDRILYRSGRFAGHVIFSEQFDTQLELLRPVTRPVGLQRPASERSGTPQPGPTHHATQRYEVCGPREQQGRIQEIASSIERNWSVPVEITLYEEPADELLALTAGRQPMDLINLRQGGYRIQPHANTGVWQKAALVAGLGALAYVAIATASGLWFSWKAEQTHDASIALYRELFPVDRRVFSPQRQMAGHLAEQGIAGSSSLALLARLTETINTNGDVTVEELRVGRGDGGVHLQLRAPSLEQLGQLQQQLRSAGFGADISSASEQGGHTTGRLHIAGDPT